jgi:4-hydroxybenzoate polyprenyltransferase
VRSGISIEEAVLEGRVTDGTEGKLARSGLSAWGYALRPDQWAKNVLVFAALVFGLRLYDSEALVRAVLAFAAFCAASSAVYLLNDIRDLERDRMHPLKRRRPIASGSISVPSAGAASGVLAAVGLGLAFGVNAALGAIVGAYLLLNVAYSFGLKHVVILDAILISIGFVLRAVGGAAAIDVVISPWLVVCTFMAALFLALGKRRAEIAALEGAAAHRPASRAYSLELLDQLMTVVVAASILSYCLYTLSPEVREKFGVSHLEVTVPFVVYGLFRYLYLVRTTGLAQNPAQALVTDRPVLLTVLLWGAAVIGLLYLQGGGVR